jgi:hypothetical protein
MSDPNSKVGEGMGTGQTSQVGPVVSTTLQDLAF